jgi:carbon-monoxide dehydrogenase small subunit
MKDVSITINGQLVTAHVEPRLTLLDFVRDVAGLKGTHAGCEHGVCGACTILVDGAAVRSCLMLAVQADGMAMITIEGVGGSNGRSGELNIIQDAFCETHGLQCGYCTPGMVLAAEALLAKNPSPSEDDVREAISGNICRCTGYVQIVEAIMLAADRLGSRNDAGLDNLAIGATGKTE